MHLARTVEIKLLGSELFELRRFRRAQPRLSSVGLSYIAESDSELAGISGRPTTRHEVSYCAQHQVKNGLTYRVHSQLVEDVHRRFSHRLLLMEQAKAQRLQSSDERRSICQQLYDRDV